MTTFYTTEAEDGTVRMSLHDLRNALRDAAGRGE